MKIEDTEVQRRLGHFKAVAREAGVKLTHQRLEIFREIAASLEHPDAEAIFRAVRPRMPTVSLDTVYRTLWMLNDLGIITALGLRRARVRFDANLEHHHHYACLRCGLTRDFESDELNALGIPEVVKGYGSIVATHVEVRGICERCAREQAGAPDAHHPQPPQGEERSGT